MPAAILDQPSNDVRFVATTNHDALAGLQRTSRSRRSRPASPRGKGAHQGTPGTLGVGGALRVVTLLGCRPSSGRAAASSDPRRASFRALPLPPPPPFARFAAPRPPALPSPLALAIDHADGDRAGEPEHHEDDDRPGRDPLLLGSLVGLRLLARGGRRRRRFGGVAATGFAGGGFAASFRAFSAAAFSAAALSAAAWSGGGLVGRGLLGGLGRAPRRRRPRCAFAFSIAAESGPPRAPSTAVVDAARSRRRACRWRRPLVGGVSPSNSFVRALELDQRLLEAGRDLRQAARPRRGPVALRPERPGRRGGAASRRPARRA